MLEPCQKMGKNRAKGNTMKRPWKYDPGIINGTIDRTIKNVINWHQGSEYDEKQIRSDLLKAIKFEGASNGYKLAKFLDDKCCRYGINTELIEILEELYYDHNTVYTEWVTKWVNWCNIRPDFKFGDYVVIQQFGEGIIIGISHKTARYKVKKVFTDKYYYLIDYERVLRKAIYTEQEKL